MAHFSKFISSRSTLFGFIAIILLSASVVIALLIQVDTWSRTSFDMLKNNTQQVRLVMIMRDAVQKRELSIQRMLNMNNVFDRDEESELFHKLAGIYIKARESLAQTVMDDVLLARLKQLDESVAYAYPYHEDLVDALIFEDTERFELSSVVLEGRKASSQVLYLLDQIVEDQDDTHNLVVTDYEASRKYTLIVIGIMFTVIALVAIFALRTSGRQFKHISRLSILDDVSGTYNRRYFDMVLEEEWMRSMREYTPLSLLMVDIDYFKAYNDSFGHQMGDVCLFTIGKVLSGQLKRTTDFTARYGGEEFAIVLPNTSVEYARLLAERLRRSVEESRIKAGNEEVSPWVTVSIGLATTTAEYEQSSAVLVKAADSCLYASKRNGRNRVTDVMLEELN
jgi:diguanylate cyclase (GGDEF)-like protein